MRDHKAAVSIKKFYGSGQMLAPDGEILCSIDRKRLQWYLDRSLADIVSEDPYQIKLRFNPSGRKHAGQAAFIEMKADKCVVCERRDYLTRHHIVPYNYRQYMPEEIKNHSSYDVMLVCRYCHDTYETEAHKLKESIGIIYNAPIGFTQIVDKELLHARKCASAILKHGDKIPEDRRGKLLQPILDYLKITKEQLTNKHLEDLRIAAHTKPVNQLHGELVAKQLDTKDKWHEFTLLWRRHFIEILKPKFLSPNWDIEKRLV